MKVSNGTGCIDAKGVVATIGFFDGVHIGHRFLITELNRIAAECGLPSVVITFIRHPRAVLQSDFQQNLLATPEEKLELLAATGVDHCVILDFTPELSGLSAKEFITSVLWEKMNVKTLLIGYDHRFGRDRADGFEQYAGYGAACGMKVIKAEPYGGGKIAVSSSVIREKLAAGDVEEAAQLFSYPYSLTGHIVKGYKVGRELGFPTANIVVNNPEQVIPGIGVYAVWVSIKEEKYKGMLYIGSRPTLDNGAEISIEVNIFDFNRDIYNDEITVSFISYIRGDYKFNDLRELKDQLAKDRERVGGLLK